MIYDTLYMIGNVCGQNPETSRCCLLKVFIDEYVEMFSNIGGGRFLLQVIYIYMYICMYVYICVCNMLYMAWCIIYAVL